MNQNNKLSVHLARKYVIETYKQKINEIRGMTKEQILRTLDGNQLKELNDLATSLSIKMTEQQVPQVVESPVESKPVPKPRGRRQM